VNGDTITHLQGLVEKSSPFLLEIFHQIFYHKTQEALPYDEQP